MDAIITPLFLYLIDSCLPKSDPNSTPLCCNSTSMFTSNLLIIVLIRLKTRQARAFRCRRALLYSIFRRENRVVTEAGCFANESFANSYFANGFGKIADCRQYVFRKKNANLMLNAGSAWQSPEPEAHNNVLDNSRSNWNLEMSHVIVQSERTVMMRREK